MTYVHRTLEPFIVKAGRQFPVLLVTGPRQVGKTSLLRHLAGTSRAYVTLDDPVQATLARDDPRLFLERFPPPVLIDEIQYAPQLLPYIKMAVDEGVKKGAFWLTGSQQFHLMKGVTESLAGRVGIVKMLGFSQFEARGIGEQQTPFLPTSALVKDRRNHVPKPAGLKALYERIWRGSFPAFALSSHDDRDLFFSSYVQTYLQRDVFEFTRLEDNRSFVKFLRAVAARTGQMLNLAELARDCDVSPPTAKGWLSILETSGLVYLLEPYHTNVTKRLVKTPKLYMLDTGLASYLTAWPSSEVLEAGPMSGAILETFVVAEVLKSYWHNGKTAPLYYFRDTEHREIDLLIVADHKIYPLEIKKSAAPGRADLRHFAALDRLGIERGEGGLFCLLDKDIPLTERDSAIPVSFV